MPSCGATVTQNLTYLIQDATTNPTTKVCAYTLCPVSESVNRIRLDFTVCNIFSIFLSTEYWLNQVPNNQLGSWHFPFSSKFFLFMLNNSPHGQVLTVFELFSISISDIGYRCSCSSCSCLYRQWFSSWRLCYWFIFSQCRWRWKIISNYLWNKYWPARWVQG